MFKAAHFSHDESEISTPVPVDMETDSTSHEPLQPDSMDATLPHSQSPDY